MRTDARLADGSRLESIPIRRYRCPLHGEVPWLPPFLCRYLHYIAEVVEQSLEEYAGTPRRIAEILEEDGPAVITIWRWIHGLLSDAVSGWIEDKLQALCLDWRSRLLPPAAERWPRPSWSRGETWNILEMARCLALAVCGPVERLFGAPFLRLGLHHTWI